MELTFKIAEKLLFDLCDFIKLKIHFSLLKNKESQNERKYKP